MTDVTPCPGCSWPIVWAARGDAPDADLLAIDAHPHDDGTVELTSTFRASPRGAVPVLVVHAAGQAAMFDAGPTVRYRLHTCWIAYTDAWPS